MGADIYMFIEHKNPVTNKWNLVKNSKWSHNMVPINRNSGLFHILCGYNKNDFNEISVICECKGLPLDIDKEAAFWLEDLAFTSYLSLEEIQNFDWDKEVYYFEEDCKHSEIAWVKSFFVCKFTFSLLGYCILCGVLAELCKDAALFFIVFCHIE